MQEEERFYGGFYESEHREEKCGGSAYCPYCEAQEEADREEGQCVNDGFDVEAENEERVKREEGRQMPMSKYYRVTAFGTDWYYGPNAANALEHVAEAIKS